MSKNAELGWKPLKYMDNLKQEIDRGISLKINGSTLLCTDLESKSSMVNFLDAPGHVNFMDETAVTLAASDLALIVIDVVEGVTSVVEQLIKQSIRNKLAICFVINKLDRLILDLKLPPMDAYLKLSHLIREINSFTKGKVFSPISNNIVFASTKLGFTFTVKEFVNYYYSSSISSFNVDDLLHGCGVKFTFIKANSKRNHSKILGSTQLLLNLFLFHSTKYSPMLSLWRKIN